ncbi:hypothetical protein I6M59_06530 [Shewanella algae]|uniref:hypothetical protein n=1 Tax=Shewanella algae TaxID=38313 RepID=UPI001AAEE39F|nr:hypothetical protein [Shewanella algae]MBO2627979.1 hypothetical protein [Shewanella algae]MBO2691405.1 hypothetical protein [Shewanella algae]
MKHSSRNRNCGKGSSTARSKTHSGWLVGLLMGQLAALVFAVPTAVLLWLATNKHLALWSNGQAFIGSQGWWLTLAVFALTALLLPRLFPSLLRKVWQLLIWF